MDATGDVPMRQAFPCMPVYGVLLRADHPRGVTLW
jgi:hypothetical protein